MADLYRFPPDWQLETLADHIPRGFHLSTEQTGATQGELLDTFDWRLYQHGWILIRDKRGYRLITIAGAKVAEFSTRRKTLLRFWWDFPAGELRNKLKPVMQERAVIPRNSISFSGNHVAIRNRDDKTVVRATVVESNHNGKSAMISTNALRGYDREHSRLLQLLRDNGFKTIDYAQFMKNLGVEETPGTYSTKLNVKMKPDTPTVEAATRIFAHLLETMRVNHAYLAEDIDTEFLHDYRVAIRRTRSALALVKGVFTPKATRRFRKNFKTLGRMTNEVRDLDVYLLDADGFRAHLPDDMGRALHPLFTHLRARRRVAFREMIKQLESPGYELAIRDWDRFIRKGYRHELGAHAKTPVMKRAQRYIGAKFVDVVEIGSAIDHTTPDDEIHRLRIECKKLRYLLEFFAPVFSKDEIKSFVATLKVLQNNLGLFNDRSVQRAFLTQFLSEYATRADAQPNTSAALGGLVVSLDRDQHEFRREFFDVFAAFNTRATRDSAIHLFGKKAAIK